MATNSKIGKTTPTFRSVLPHKLKATSLMRQDIQSWRRVQQLALNDDAPMNWGLQLLLNNIRLDALLSSQIDNRKDQTANASYSIYDASGNEDEEATIRLSNSIAFNKIIDEYQESLLLGYSLIELGLNPNGELQVVSLPRTNTVPQKGLFYYDFLEQTKSEKYRELREYGTHILEFNNLDVATQNFGLLNKVVPHVLMKRFAQTCWSELCEIFGIPPRVLKTNTQDPGMLSRGDAMMRDMGAAAYFIIDETEELEFAQGASTNGDVYKNLINLCNNEISLLISGAVYGQDTVNGNRSKDESAQEILWQKVLADQLSIEQAMNTSILPALARLGVVKEGSTLKYAEAEDTDKLFKYAQPFLTSNKYRVTPEWIKDKFGVEVEEVKTSEEPVNKKLSANLPDNFFD